jgi:hypothetical protein
MFCWFFRRSLGMVGERLHEVEVIVGCNAVVTHHAATETPMDDRVFTVRPNEVTGRRHERSAIAGAVARTPLVKVTRVKTVGAVIALAAA